MNQWFPSIFLFALLWSPLSHSKPDLNLLETTMKNTVVTDQKNDKNCYTHAAHHLLNTFFHQNEILAPNIKISPESLLATSYYDRSKYTTIHGRTCDQIYNLRDHGSCENQATLNYLKEIIGGDPVEFEKAKKRLQNSIKKKSRYNKSNRYCKAALKNTLEQESLGSVDEFLLNFRRVLRKNKDFPYILMANYLTKKCKSEGNWLDIPLDKIPHCERFDYKEAENHKELYSPDEFVQKIDSLLEEGIPAGVAYCLNILKDSKKQKYIKNRRFPKNILEFSQYDFSQNYESDCGYHASVVIGRKKINGKLYYGILNSWGTQNIGHADDVILEKGIYWVEESKLKNNIYKVHYLIAR